ncbi:MAG: endonuclease/exonuclease/phosphatase family protein [Verrucomicrobia bacterium]|nr:endonuclease/exonuclease/phosphatase family protein [Verrucomicrobiota bacterium]MBU1735290.1 endonuclease/exonuclease/phosphatase family protein [Verrucomicrobiota bacterium]MBU1856143.1 endonuclease/exonuclease/phosphatase family protein [Verrucomicrobiota bacterium]
MKILTCNLRGYGKGDGHNAWIHRKELCIDVIKSERPDVISFQEMEQFADLTSAFPEYDTYAMVDEPCGRRQMNCIFYRRDGYARISAGGYWLSQTPHVAGSKSWDSACVRLVNWIRLEDSTTKKEFRIVNTHLDHVSQPAREKQAELIVADSCAYPSAYPQVLTGDMNCDSTNKTIAILKAGGWIDTYGTAHGTENPGHTYHAFLGPEYNSSIGKMDWIFTRGEILVNNAKVITHATNGRFPSDHYFISATLIIGTLPQKRAK